MDEPAWRQILPRIFSNLVDTVIKNKQRQNRSKGTKNYSVTEDMVALASQVGRQVFFEANKAMDLTQIVPIEQTQFGTAPSSRPPNKKRRVEMSFEVCFLEKLKRNSNEDEEVIVPWLQILAAMIPFLPHDVVVIQGMFNCTEMN